MADLYGELTSDNSIKRFYVVPDSGAAGSNQLLISNVKRDEANNYKIRKLISISYGYKYKWTGSVIAEKTDTEIRASLSWMEQKKSQLDSAATKDISDLGENKLHSLCVKDAMNRLNSGPTLTSDEITDMQNFDDSRATIRTQFHADSEASGFSRLKIDSTAINTTSVDVKNPGAFTANDNVTIIDYSDGKRETTSITSITGNKLILSPLSNTTKYIKKTSWVFKAQ